MLPAKDRSYLNHGRRTAAAGAVSLVHCRREKTSLGCSVTVEHEALNGLDDVVCSLRIHGRLGERVTNEKVNQGASVLDLSPPFLIAMARDRRTQTYFVLNDVGEV